MSDRSLDHLAPGLKVIAQKFLDLCAQAPELRGCRVFLTETWRSEAEQDADYQQGRTMPGKVITNAQFGQSPHNHTLPDGTPAALAFDIAIETAGGKLDWNANDPAWRKAIDIGTSLGLVNGGSFTHLRDTPHFEIAHYRNIMNNGSKPETA